MIAGSLFTAATFAQTKTVAAPAKPVVAAKQELKKAAVATAAAAKTEVKKAETAKPVVAAKTEAKKVEAMKPVVKDAGMKLKKDGTPDMRMKGNKAGAELKVAAGPLKKDGTPDMRYNDNKKADAKPAKKG